MNQTQKQLTIYQLQVLPVSYGRDNRLIKHYSKALKVFKAFFFIPRT